MWTQKKQQGEKKMRDVWYILFGYLSGSILYARIFGELIAHRDITKQTKDKNPGTANAFMQGGFWCGVLTLAGDLLKGFVPVYFYLLHLTGRPGIALAFVVAAPVAGHIFPLLYVLQLLRHRAAEAFQGGKGIAVSFGTLLGLFGRFGLRPALLLAFSFLFFSGIVRVTPHYYRTLWTYINTGILMHFQHFRIEDRNIRVGFLLITAMVVYHLCRSTEEKEAMQVRILWQQ